MEANEVRRGSKETLLLIDHFLFPGYTRPRLRYKFSLRTKITTIVSDPSAIPSGKKLASRHRSIAPIYLLFATVHRRRNLHAGIPKTIRMQLTAVETYACWGVTRVNPAHVNMNHWTRIPRFRAGGEGEEEEQPRTVSRLGSERLLGVSSVARSRNASGIPGSSCPRVLSNS